MLILGLISLFVCVTIFLWLLGWPWLKVKLASNQPLWWPWLVFLSPWFAFLLTWRMRQNFTKIKARSGIQDCWTDELWLTHKMFTAVFIAILFVMIAIFIDLAYKIILLICLLGLFIGYIWPEAKLRNIAKKRQLVMQTELPFMLDLLNLCVKSGLSLAAALQKVAEYSPAGPLRDSLRNSSAMERTGMKRSEWLAHWAQTSELEGIENLVLALSQADQSGMNLEPVLRAQAEQQRSARFVRAETMALQAPVKMLFPMVICIFPCTFLIIGFPILIKLLEFNF